MKKYFNKTTTAILLLLGAVLIGVFLLWPMLQEFLRVEHELEQYNIALVGREKYVSNLVILARQLDALRRVDLQHRLGNARIRRLKALLELDLDHNLIVVADLELVRQQRRRNDERVVRHSPAADQQRQQQELQHKPFSDIKFGPRRLAVT